MKHIGFNLQLLDRYAEAIEYHQNALMLWEQEGNVNEQALNHEQIGWNLRQLGRHAKATEYHQKAAALRKKEENVNKQAWNLEHIGGNAEKLGRHAEAIKYYQKAAALRKKEENISEQAWNLERIGIGLVTLGRYSKAIEYHQKALIIREEEGNISGQTWNLGHISTNLLLLNRDDEAWMLWQNETQRHPAAFKEWGDAIYYLEKSGDIVAAFGLVNRILHRLPREVPTEEISFLLTVFFADLINMQISEPFLRDIAEEAIRLFPEPSQQVSAEAALHVAGFITAHRTGDGELYLENLHPDMAIAVRAIAREAKLDI